MQDYNLKQVEAHRNDNSPNDLRITSESVPETIADTAMEAFSLHHTHIGNALNTPFSAEQKAITYPKPTPEMNLADWVFHWARQTPEQIALCWGNQQQGIQRLNYGQLSAQIRQVARQWQGLFTERSFTEEERHVGLLLHNTLDFVVHYYALLWLGIGVIPLNTHLTGKEISTILVDAGATFLVSSQDFNSVFNELGDWGQFNANSPKKPLLLLSELAAPLKKSILETKETKKNIGIESLLFSSLPLANGDQEDLPQKLNRESIATLIYTSGTTGKPKGVMLSHHNILSDAWGNAIVIEAKPEDVFITISPLFHVFGQTNVLCTAMMAGACVVLVKKFAPSTILQAIEQHKVTFMAAVPTMYQMMLAQLAEYPVDLSSLRVCHSGAAPMSQTVFHQVEAAFGAPVQEGYGLSEASSIVTSNPLYASRKPGSVGQALPGVSLKVVDDELREVQPNTVGELLVKGDTVMLGYYRQTELTKKVLHVDGWLQTGDMASIDEEGYVQIKDRRDDLINVGGVKVYPREIEDVLYQHPAIASVAVVGIPNARLTHIVKAYVVLKAEENLGAKQLKRYCRMYLAAYKIPQSIDFVETIPQGATGKILRKELRAVAAGADL